MLEPSEQIQHLLATVTDRSDTSQGLRSMMQRQSEFPSPLAAQLTGIALDADGRAAADQALDAYWSSQARRDELLGTRALDREVVIGSGFHAAVYAAVRVLSGYPKPLVLERNERVGGTFAMTARPTFYLNSRNRTGFSGLAGDQASSLNYLPGAPIQAANVSMREYQTNTDMAFVIRLTLAQFAYVATSTTVTAVSGSGGGVDVDLGDRPSLRAARVIDARGLGDPSAQGDANGTTILTFPQFMARMAGRWPLRGVRRAAVIGGGDSAKCVVESLLGIAPQPLMAAAALDSVDRIIWYSTTLPTTCEGWQEEIRGRYQAIGRYLRPDRYGVQRLNVIGRRARPVALPTTALVDGCAYDLAIVCTGNQESTVEGLGFDAFTEWLAPNGEAVARIHYNLPAFRVGPAAQLPLTPREIDDGVASIAANQVSMFRTANKTAVLAASLPAAMQG